ncbi:MAG: YkgJ family cysteine cluster protein [Nitrospirales bacterium]
MNTMDTRVKGTLSKKLHRLGRAVLETDELVDPAMVKVKKNRGSFEIPDCRNCLDRCCVHKKVGEGILLSLRDIATLVDSGLGDYIVGRYTFKKKKGQVIPEVDKMPRLKSQKNGNCVFYDEEPGLCTQYGLRPTICRRFPYEVDYEMRKSGEVPIARFISGLPCPKISTRDYGETVQQLVVDAVEDENISLEDDQLLPKHHEALRKMGFGPYLPSPEDCPS